jgi:hypothetical protein
VFNDLATYISIANVIKAVTYHTESDTPSIEERTITFWLTEPDGTGTEALIRKCQSHRIMIRLIIMRLIYWN